MKTQTEFLLKPVPFKEAATFIRGKPAVSREVFDRLLPDLKARAFTISGIENMSILQKVRDRIADLPKGANWDDVKADVADRLTPYFLDSGADADTQAAQIAAAERRAELLLRTHGFESYQAAQYEVMTRQKETFEFWMYQTMDDEAVRPEHAALNGLILPANSTFWSDHYPPWDWGCRCQVVPVMREELAEIEERDAGFTLSAAQREALETGGVLDLGDAHPINVSSPRARGEDGAFSWNPGSLSLPIEGLRDQYDPEVWSAFESWAKAQEIETNGPSVLDWLTGKKKHTT